jgi:hypothetical protein
MPNAAVVTFATSTPLHAETDGPRGLPSLSRWPRWPGTLPCRRATNPAATPTPVTQIDPMT